MQLSEYISTIDGSEVTFARRAGVPQRTVNRVCNGGGCNLRTANLIVKASHERPTPSGGVVTFEELVPAESAA